MTAQLGLLAPTEAELRAEETDTAERSDDPTPRGVIRAVLSQLFSLTVDPRQGRRVTQVSTHWYPRDYPKHSAAAFDVTKGPVRVLDVCAGYGAWASEMRRLARRQGWPVHITGVELLAARERHLRKWCDEVVTGDWRQALGRDVACLADEYTGSQDIIIGNPHFPGLTHENPARSMPAVLLEHAPAVLLLHTQQAFLKSEAGRAAWRLHPPAASWLVPGGVKFRGPDVGADSRCYQVTLWLRGHEGPCSVHLLDDLDPRARSWRVPPGSEEPSADPPAAPGWTP